MKTFTHITMLAVAVGLAGCGGQSEKARMLKPPEPVARVDKIAILSMPSAINFDNIPGPDGIKVQALLFQVDRAAPVLTSGTLQFLLYENKITPSEMHTLRPHLVWTFSGEKLDRHRARSMLGWGYAMELRWGRRSPKSKTISLAARYTRPDGRTIYASPIVIALR